jgi:hypothetical protein
MEFPTLDLFKNVVRDFTNHLGRDIYWVKNDKKRARARCMDDTCDWEIFCGWSKFTQSYQIKIYKDAHACKKSYTNQQATQSWVVRKLVNELRPAPNFK